MYYRNAQAAIVVYDVTKAATLERAKSWIKELQRQANPHIVIALVGNKIDLAEENQADNEEQEEDDAASVGRQVPTEDAAAYASEAGLLFMETSAKTGHNVEEMFTEIGMYLVYIIYYWIQILLIRKKNLQLKTSPLNISCTLAEALEEEMVLQAATQESTLCVKALPAAPVQVAALVKERNSILHDNPILVQKHLYTHSQHIFHTTETHRFSSVLL